MAQHTVPAGHVGIHVEALEAGLVDTITFTGVDLNEVEIMTDGASDIFVSFGAGNTPTVAGTHCWRVQNLPGSAILPVRTSGDTVVNLVSSGTPTYSVART